MNRNLYRRTWLKLHRSYEKRMFRMLRNDIRKMVLRVNLENLNENTYINLLDFNISQSQFFESYQNMYLMIGTLHGKRIGAGINRDMKRFDIDQFAVDYRRTLSEWLAENAGLRIVTVRASLLDYLAKVISDGFKDGKGPREIARMIHRLVRSRGFYRWQALRIARTEATAAANLGASVAGRNSGIVLEKEWISSNDSRTRRRPEDKFDHIEVDGQKTSEKGLFNVQGDLIRFPGDPKGRPANTINCRCTVAVVPKRDRDGRLVFKQ